MKSSRILSISILLIIAGILIVSTFNRPPASAQGLNTAAWRAQITSTPATEDNSVIGSTNGIVVMGILIVFIVTTPLVFRRKKK